MEHFRHFVGGASFGFLAGLIVIPRNPSQKNDHWLVLTAASIMSVLCGLITWGLWS